MVSKINREETRKIAEKMVEEIYDPEKELQKIQ